MELIIFTSPDAGRAAMAAGFFNSLVTPAVACGLAAVPDPHLPLDPKVTAAFEELRLGRSLLQPTRFTIQLAGWAAEIIQVGTATRSFPIRDAKTIEWDIASPMQKPLEDVKNIRDAIQEAVASFLRKRRWLRKLRDRSGNPAPDGD